MRPTGHHPRFRRRLPRGHRGVACPVNRTGS
jgi:hypothetical protein